MKNFIKKPVKEYNIIDMGILTIGAIATIPVGFFIFCKGFDILERLDESHKHVKLSELENDDEPLMTEYDEEETE